MPMVEIRLAPNKTLEKWVNDDELETLKKTHEILAVEQPVRPEIEAPEPVRPAQPEPAKAEPKRTPFKTDEDFDFSFGVGLVLPKINQQIKRDVREQATKEVVELSKKYPDKEFKITHQTFVTKDNGEVVRVE